MPPADRLGHPRRGHRLVPPAPADDRHRLVLPAHRPVALRHLPRRRARLPARHRPVPRPGHRRPAGPLGPGRLDALLPHLRPQPARPGRRGRRPRPRPRGARHRRTARRAPGVRLRGPGRPRQLAPGDDPLAGQPARLLRQGRRVLQQAPAGHPLLAAGPRGRTGTAPARRPLARGGTRGQARPAALAGLPDDLLHPAVRRRAARRHLVREARPVLHRHAPLRALLRPGRRPALAGPHRLRRLPRDRRTVLRTRRRAPRGAARPGRHPAPARHPRRDGAARRHRPGLARRRLRARPRRHPAEPDGRRTRLPRRGGEDGRARPAGRAARSARQGRGAAARRGGRAAQGPQRGRPRRPGRRASAAGHRRQGRGHRARALRHHQRAARHPGLPGPGTAHRTGVGTPRGRERGPPGHLRRHPGRPRPGDHLARVVRQRVRRAPLQPVHRQHRAPQALAHAQWPPALLPRPRLDARTRRGPAGLPAAARPAPALRRTGPRG